MRYLAIVTFVLAACGGTDATAETGDVTLESALEFINDDELVEVTPESIRIRKRYLLEHQRKRDMRRREALVIQ